MRSRLVIFVLGLFLAVSTTGCAPTLVETLATGVELLENLTTGTTEEENELPKDKDEPSCYDWVQIPGYRVGEYKIAFRGRETTIGGNIIPGPEKLYRRSDYNTFDAFSSCFDHDLQEQLDDSYFYQYFKDTLEWEDWMKYIDGLYDFSGTGRISGSLGKYHGREEDQCRQYFMEKSNELLGKLCNQN